MINVIRRDVYLSYTNNLFPCQLRFVNYFPWIKAITCSFGFLKTPFKPAKDAL